MKVAQLREILILPIVETTMDVIFTQGMLSITNGEKVIIQVDSENVFIPIEQIENLRSKLSIATLGPEQFFTGKEILEKVNEVVEVPKEEPIEVVVIEGVES